MGIFGFEGKLDQEAAKKSPDLFLMSIPECECNCYLCNRACEEAPCWGLPSEIERLMDEGYGNKLSDYVVEPGYYHLPNTRVRTHWPNPDVHIIAPAATGYGGLRRGSTPTFITFRGRCVFLRGRGRKTVCELHPTGLKPIEGRVASHDTSFDDGILIREAIIDVWDTDYGRSVVSRWLYDFSKYRI